ncbi:hypothetical protein D3C85_1545370 [compost metagenome]
MVRLFSTLNTLPEPGARAAGFMEGKAIHCQTNAIAATGTSAKNAPRQPMMEPK